MACLLALPAELTAEIASHLSNHDIKQLCETSRCCQGVYTPLLYRTIDLSCHHADVQCDALGLSYHTVPPDFVWRYPTGMDYAVFQQQKSFIEALKAKPALGSLVYRFRWTVLDLPCLSYGRSEDQWSPVASKVRRFALPWKGCRNFDRGPYSGDFWPTLQKLVNVTNIDLCWLSQKRDLVVPDQIFPKATSVRLAGCTTVETIQCILSQSIRSLQRLELHNVLKWPDLVAPLPGIRDWGEWKEYWKENAEKHDNVEATGRMAGALGSFVGKFTALTSLSIITVGDEAAAFHQEVDEQLYTEWSCLIDSLRGQLRYLNFKQGISRNQNGGQRCVTTWARRQHLVHRPMDLLFHAWILPVLLREPWPHIHRMEIQGVGRDLKFQFVHHIPAHEERAGREGPEYMFDALPGRRYGKKHIRAIFDPLVREQVRNVLPDDAELVIEEDSERDYEDVCSQNDLIGINFEDEYHVGCCGPRASSDEDLKWYGNVDDDRVPLRWRELIAPSSAT